MKLLYGGQSLPAFQFINELKKRLTECQALGKATCSTSVSGRCCFIRALFEPLDRIGLHRERRQVCAWLLKKLEEAADIARRDPELGDVMEFVITGPERSAWQVAWHFNIIDPRKEFDASKTTRHINFSQSIGAGGLSMNLSIPFNDAVNTTHLRGGDEDPLSYSFSTHS